MTRPEQQRGAPRPRYGRWRRATQVAVTLVFLGLPFLAGVGVNGTYVALRVGPVDLLEPSAAASALVASGELAWSVLLAAAPPVAIALLLGPVYCSWGCPFGLASELIDLARQRRRRTAWAKGTAAAARRPRWLTLALLLLLALPLGFPILALLSPPRLATALPLEAYAIRALPLLTAALLAALVLVELLGPRRLLCRVLCPAGAVAALLRRRTTLGPRFDRARCFCPGAPPCLLECPWAIDPRSMRPRDGCTTCLACIERCPSGALSVAFRSAKRVEEAGPDRRREAEER